ncbi:23534_t:CDS:1, partial [Gigaspora margarita]
MKSPLEKTPKLAIPKLKDIKKHTNDKESKTTNDDDFSNNALVTTILIVKPPKSKMT